MMLMQGHQPSTDNQPRGRGVQASSTLDGFAREFADSTENQVLRRRLSDEIAVHGPITFRRFMEVTLYDPHEGYYFASRPPVGSRGDYLTSPEVHPLFGGLIARQLEEMWRNLGEPSPFRIVEIGAGNATLARAILAVGAPSPFQAAISYTIVERSPAQQAVQEATLGSLAALVTWSRSLRELPQSAHCVLSNELVDSFPVHRVMVDNGRLREIFVTLDGDEFVDYIDDFSTPDLPAYFERLGLLPGDGCMAEVNLDALAWVAEVSEVVEHGYVVTIDYGYPASLLYAPWRSQGTLLCFHHHGVGTDPYRRIGRQDITAHVDFTTFARAGAQCGLALVGFTSQQQFLSSLGIGDALSGGPSANGLEEYLARRRAVQALLDPEGLGRIRVVAQARGAALTPLRGFADSPFANEALL